MPNHWLTGCVCVAAGGAVALSLYLYRRHRWYYVSDFVEIGHVSQLNIYPTKSMRGISVEAMECKRVGGKAGELQDRVFMVMDEETGNVVTTHEISKLAITNVTIKDNTLTLNLGTDSYYLDIDRVVREGKPRRVELWEGLKQDGLDCGDDVAKFLRKIYATDYNLRLVHYVDGLYTERDVVPKQEMILSPVPKRCDPIAFQNDGPYMAICESSLDDLNSRFPPERQFEMIRFRPTMQISGTPPFDEDMWAELKIGDVTFSCYLPCSRCIAITVDPETGIREADNQPLKELRKYRLAPGKLRQKYKQSPIMGVNMGVITEGSISVGDKVYARYKTHPF